MMGIVDYYDTDEALAKAGRFRELQARRTQRELNRKNKARESRETATYAKPTSGLPIARRPKQRKPNGIDYWRLRAQAAENALRMRGGTPPAGDQFYQSDAWRTLRYQALKQHGGACQLCGATGRLHVDHIKPRSKFPNLELRLDNLQVLCADCNLGKGAWDDSDWRKGRLQSIPGAT